MLAAHRLEDAAHEQFAHTGFSLAQLRRLQRPDGASFILKRMSFNDDWIMHATDDRQCREAVMAEQLVSVLPARIRSPGIGVAHDGLGFALLMRDITPDLLPQGDLPDDVVTTIVARMAELHAAEPPKAVPWCSLGKRLLLLAPAAGRRDYVLRTMGAAVNDDLYRGWLAFDRLAPPQARDLVHGLAADVRPLVRALDMQPRAFLHGDLKFDNIGLDAERRTWLIDWALTLVAPPAVELGWFMAINSRRMTMPLDRVLDAYADAAGPGGGRAANDGLAAICGVLLRGWRKALDAEAGEPGELQWWCERAEAAARLL